MPSVIKLPTVHSCTPTPDNDSENSDLTSLPLEAGSNSSLEEDLSETMNDRHIPKPPGKAGRLSQGGYTLTTVLDWLVKDYKKLKVIIQCVLPLLCVNTLHCRNVYTKESRIILIIQIAPVIRILLP